MTDSIIRLPVTPPFPWSRLLAYLSARLIPCFETIDGDRYTRQHNGTQIKVIYNTQQGELEVHLNKASNNEKEISQRVSRLFFPTLETNAIYRRLSPLLPAAKKISGFRPLGCWDPFELCIRTVIGQQVSVSAAQTLTSRLVNRCGELTPAAILQANLENIGMPQRRIQTIINFAQTLVDGEIDLSWPWSRLDQTLSKLSGIGPWTRGYLAIRLGREMDAFPETDLGLIRAAGVDNAKQLLELAEQWRPYRSFAAACLWASG